MAKKRAIKSTTENYAKKALTLYDDGIVLPITGSHRKNTVPHPMNYTIKKSNSTCCLQIFLLAIYPHRRRLSERSHST